MNNLNYNETLNEKASEILVQAARDAQLLKNFNIKEFEVSNILAEKLARLEFCDQTNERVNRILVQAAKKAKKIKDDDTSIEDFEVAYILAEKLAAIELLNKL